MTDCSTLLLEGLGRLGPGLQRLLADLSTQQLAWRPGPRTNSIAWLAWHMGRVQDAQIASLAQGPQAWIAAGWHARFERPADPRDTGYGQSADQAAAFHAPSTGVLLDYHAAASACARSYVERLSCADLDRVIDTSYDPPVTVGVRVMSIIDDCAQHLGQIGYVRGLLP